MLALLLILSSWEESIFYIYLNILYCMVKTKTTDVLPDFKKKRVKI